MLHICAHVPTKISLLGFDIAPFFETGTDIVFFLCTFTVQFTHSGGFCIAAALGQ